MRSTFLAISIDLRTLYMILIQLVFVWQVQSQPATWTSGGPAVGGSVIDMVMAPSDSDVLYALDATAVYRSNDSGNTWIRRSEIAALTIEVASDNADIIFAGTDGDGVRKSIDGGATWVDKGLPGAVVNALAVHPSNASIVFAAAGEPKISYGSEVIGIFKSEDGGDSWVQKPTTTLGAVTSLLIDSNNANHVYAGVDDGDMIRKSTDGGETWQDFFPKSSRHILALAMTPTGYAPATMYAMVWGDDVYKSVDNGESWVATNAPWVSTGSPWSIAVHPDAPMTVFYSSPYFNGSVFKSADAGGSWSISTNGLASGSSSVASSILIHPSSGDVLISCPRVDGLFRSDNQGSSWAPMSPVRARADITYLAVHRDDADIVYAVSPGDENQLWASTDGGTSWDILANSPADLGAVAIDPQDPTTVWAGDGYELKNLFNVHRSGDSGASWSSIGFVQYSPGQNIMEISDIIIHPQNSNYILVAAKFLTSNGPPQGEGILARSLTGGSSWTKIGFSTTAMAIDPNDPSTVIAGKESIGQVFRYTNVWGSYQATEITPVGGIGSVRDIDIDFDSNVFISSSSGLWRWNGSVWQVLNGFPSDDFTSVSVDRSSHPGIVYAGTGTDGVFVSENSGNTWSAFSDDLPNLNITGLSLAEGYLYAGTSHGGVWRREALATTLLVPETPTLITPALSATSQPTSISFTWSAAARADTYQFQLSKSPTFQSLILDQNGLATTQHNVNNLDLGATYYWRVRAHNSAGPGPWATGTFSVTGVASEVSATIPTTYDLKQNYPNPFNPSTTIVFELPQTSAVRLSVYDVTGRLISTLVDRVVFAGVHEVTFSGLSLPSGSYVYQLETPNETISKMMTVLK